MSYKVKDLLNEGIAIPGNVHWNGSINRAKEHIKSGSSAEMLYNQHQNVPKRHFARF